MSGPGAQTCGLEWAEWFLAPPGRELGGAETRCAGMELTCPKCHGTMRTYERNGVHVDQCTECRGIFLDRGELDRLIDAENDWHGGGAPTGGRSHEPSEHQRSDYPSSGHQQGAAASAGLGGVVGEVLRQVQGSKHSSHSSSHGRRKKESFLGDLFG
jgi:Zn-finger nucleic acid-binding protein